MDGNGYCGAISKSEAVGPRVYQPVYRLGYRAHVLLNDVLGTGEGSIVELWGGNVSNVPGVGSHQGYDIMVLLLFPRFLHYLDTSLDDLVIERTGRFGPPGR